MLLVDKLSEVTTMNQDHSLLHLSLTYKADIECLSSRSIDKQLSEKSAQICIILESWKLAASINLFEILLKLLKFAILCNFLSVLLH